MEHYRLMGKKLDGKWCITDEQYAFYYNLPDNFPVMEDTEREKALSDARIALEAHIKKQKDSLKPREDTYMMYDDFCDPVIEKRKRDVSLHNARHEIEKDIVDSMVENGKQIRADLSNGICPIPKDFIDYCFDANGPEPRDWKYRNFAIFTKGMRDHAHCQYPLLWRRSIAGLLDMISHASVKSATFIEAFGIDNECRSFYDGVKPGNIYAIDPKNTRWFGSSYGFLVFNILFEDGNKKTIHFFTEESITRSDMEMLTNYEKETAHVVLEKYIDRCKRLAVPGYDPVLSYTKISKEDLTHV